MKRNISKSFNIIVIALVLFAVSSCQYAYIEFDKPDETKVVRFSEDIAPIFTDKECVTCHQQGISSIDLNENQAYVSITEKLINHDSLELSKIFVFPNPESFIHQYKKYTPEQAALVLLWLKQGAKND